MAQALHRCAGALSGHLQPGREGQDGAAGEQFGEAAANIWLLRVIVSGLNKNFGGLLMLFVFSAAHACALHGMTTVQLQLQLQCKISHEVMTRLTS